MSPALPPWLAQAIEDKTGWTAGGRWARRGRCGTCGSVVVSGPDSDWAAVEVQADVEPLDRTGELSARFCDRWTFALRVRGTRLELTRRDKWQIKGEPAGEHNTGFRPYLVVAEHRCKGKSR